MIYRRCGSSHLLQTPMNISKGMSIEDHNLLQVAREFYQDSKFTHDIAQKGLNERFADSKISLSPKSLGERKRLDDMVVKNLRDMNVYMDVVQ